MTARWGALGATPGDRGSWALGALRLHAAREPQEWRLTSWHEGDPLQDTLECASQPAAVVPPTDADGDSAPISPAPEVTRFTLGPEDELDQAASTLLVSPALPDRPVVVRPETPTQVLGGQRVTLWLSLPLVARVSLASHTEPLLEVETAPAQSTWFGASTREGEHCYAGRTSARVDLSMLPRRPVRAACAVVVHNPGKGHVRIERLKVPCPELALYAAEDGRLWTATTTITLGDGGAGRGEVDVAGAPPPVAGRCERLVEPRHSGGDGMLRKAFRAVIG